MESPRRRWPALSDSSWLLLPPPLRTRHYSHAPIAEAIIDIRCDLLPTTTLESLRQAVDDPAFGQPEKSIALQQVMNFTDEGVEGTTTGKQIGHLFRRDDGHRVVHPRLDGFSYSWVGLYETWEKFVAEAETHWMRYRAVASPTRVTRLGVRYVNRIDVPSNAIEIKDYLRLTADVPAYLPQMITNYFMQVEVPLKEYGCTATITSSLLQPTQAGTTSLLLDVDTWQMTEIELIESAEAEGVTERLGVLRHAKNYVFESCITDATRGLIR